MANTILEARAIISAEDRTKDVFSGIEKRIDALSRAMNNGVAGKLDLIGGLSNFDSRQRSADMVKRMAQVAPAADAASVALSNLGKTLGSLKAIMLPLAAMKVDQFAKDALHTYREFDKERRFQKAVMGLTDEEQAPLVKQAIHGGSVTKYNDIQFLEAQRELAARGLNRDQILGFMEPAANLGQSLDLSLPDSVRQMEGAIFGFKKNISTLADATASAAQTADIQVKAAKISGMKPEDITQLYKYGATPAHLAGISEASLLAFGAISKKANMGGDESGVAFRALVAAGESPTSGARTAMRAAGMRYADYQRAPDRLAMSPFVADVAERYGVKLDRHAQSALGAIFGNKALIASPEKFNPAVVGVLRDVLGGADAKSLKSIAGEASRYRSASMKGVDMNALITDLMLKLPGNLQLANAIFGPKQGARIANAFSDPKVFKHMLDELNNHSAGYSEKVAAERMAGFDGAMSKLEGSVKNLETAFGRANDAWLTPAINQGAKFVQSLAEMDAGAQRVATGLGALIVGLGSIQTLLLGARILSGGAAAAPAIPGAVGGAVTGAAASGLGRLGPLAGLGAGAYAGKSAFDIYRGMPDSNDLAPQNTLERWADKFDRWAGLTRSPTPYAGAVPFDQYHGSPELHLPRGGAPIVSRLEGSASIVSRIELSLNNDMFAAQVRQVIHADGALRADTGESMPEARPGALRGE